MHRALLVVLEVAFRKQAKASRKVKDGDGKRRVCSFY